MKLSRREFMKEACGFAGASVLSLTLDACTNETAAPETTPTTSTTPTTPATSSGTTPVPTTPAAQTSGTPLYDPPADKPLLKLVPGCTSWVAMDRMYTVEHVWVKTLESGRVVLGITDKLQLLMSRITALTLRKEGEPITQAEPFGYAQGDKMSVDIIAPVSGNVVQVNNDIWAGGGDNDGLDLITSDPYVRGWMAVVQMTKPAEMENLITPEKYMELNAKTVS